MKAYSLLLATLMLWSSMPGAHPLGNNTVNRQAAIQIGTEQLELRYLMDLAEIPTLIQQQDADVNGDGVTSDSEWESYARHWVEEVASGLELQLDETRAALRLREAHWRLVPGAADLSTLRLEAVYTASVGAATRLRYSDRYKIAQTGWKEVYISAFQGMKITRADVPQVDRSHGLTQYPDSLQRQYPNDTEASAEFVSTPGAPDLEPANKPPMPAMQARPRPMRRQWLRPKLRSGFGPSSSLACITSPPAGTTSCSCSVCCFCASLSDDWSG